MRSVPLVYEAGTKRISASGSTITFDDGGVGAGITSLDGTEQALLAARLAPPTARGTMHGGRSAGASSS